jgi:two-component system chemotaxis response regulator CheB
MITTNPIRVLSIDGSAFFHKQLGEILGPRVDISLVGCANDAYDARDQLRSVPVDVLMLDLELPRMRGLTFLKLLMNRKPMPVIVLSSEMPIGSQKAVEALIAGAVEVIEKPKSPADTVSFGERLIDGIKKAAALPKRPRLGSVTRSIFSSISLTSAFTRGSKYGPRQIIAIGASTGGTQALEAVLTKLPDNLPGIVVVQHIPADFSARFAERLDHACAMDVREAKNGDAVRPGLALIAPGDRHMEIQWIRDSYRVLLHDGPKVEHQRPSVDVLFHSLADCAGRHTVAVLLTGMGHDGAAGMKHLHDLKAQTIAQDARSSVVYGMARKAVELKAVDSIVSLEKLADKIIKALKNDRNRTTPVSHE